MIDTVTFERTTFLDPPARFEAGTPHIVGASRASCRGKWVEKSRSTPSTPTNARSRRMSRRSAQVSAASRSTDPKIALASSASTSTGCIPTIPPPYWTMRASRFAPVTIALNH